MARWTSVGTVGVAVAAVLAGCAGADDLGAAGSARDVDERWTSCVETAPEMTGRGRSPASAMIALGGFEPAGVVICERRDEPRPDGGSQAVVIESRATDIAALYAALGLPGESRSTTVECTADAPAEPWLALLDKRGRWVRPELPRDGCGKVRGEVYRAVEALRLTRVGRWPVGGPTPGPDPRAVAAGCEEPWADMVWVVRNNPGNARPGRPPAMQPLDRTLTRLCAYDVPADQRRTDKPAGEFAYGGPLTADRRARIERELRRAGPAATCNQPASRFAVLHDSVGHEVYVELDGCRQVMVVGSLRQADDELLELLERQ